MQLKKLSLQWASNYLKFLMQKIFLKIFSFQTVIFDLSEPGISKKERNLSTLRPKERKTSLMQLKTFLYVS